MLIQAIRDNDPVIFLEHKMLYSLQGEVPEELYTVPFGEANFVREGKDVTLVTYLCDLKESQIRDGLHIVGESPEGRLRID
ncbi:alpha-ketoacid dehydrogenase subunit beta, partial [Klebsiella pneumoniae]